MASLDDVQPSRPTRRPASRLAALASVAVLLVGAAGCGADDPAEPAGSASTAAADDTAAPIPAADALALVADGADVIDVRTPEEFDSGHLDGAVNIDYQADDFVERVEELPREASYVVYCASGRRATGAVEQMRELGFADVVNGGGYADLAG